MNELDVYLRHLVIIYLISLHIPQMDTNSVFLYIFLAKLITIIYKQVQ